MDLVNVLLITDRKGRLVSDLEKQNLKSLNNDRRRYQLHRETDLPLTIAILIDTSRASGSLQFDSKPLLISHRTFARKTKPC
jgi:hypothetical protein